VLLGRGLDGRCIEEMDQLLPGIISCSSSRHGVDTKIRKGRQAAAIGLVVVFTFFLDRRQQLGFAGTFLLRSNNNNAISFGGISRAKMATR
jgi:hypothetical protein